MKRVMFAAMLLVSTASVFATETNGKNENQQSVVVAAQTNVYSECEVTISTKVGPSFAQVEVKCSYKASTCREAISSVLQCLEDAKKAIMK